MSDTYSHALKDIEIKKLKKRIRKLETALKIVSTHSEKTERRMRKQFDHISDTIPAPLIITNPIGDVVFFNVSTQQMFGYRKEDIHTIKMDELYENPGTRHVFLEKMTQKGEINGFRTNLKKKDGDDFPAILYSRCIDYDGEQAILTVIHDLTEVMQLEAQLRQIEKLEAIGTMTSGIAHDFNNILGAISGYSELMKLSLKNKRAHKELKYLDKISQASDRAKNMIMQMMAFCRESEGTRVPFSLNTVAEEVVSLMIKLVSEHIDIRLDLKDPSLMIMGDSTQIHQVLTNLVSNAIYAVSKQGGTIWISLSKVEKEKIPKSTNESSQFTTPHVAKLTVRDSGSGIPETVIDQIFDPFFTTKPVGQGSGMGLAVVHGIVKRHNGFISVQSSSEKGTTMDCFFPLLEEDSDAVAERDSDGTVSPDADNAFSAKHILVIDDDPLILDFLTQALTAQGYQVSSFEKPKEALDTLKTCTDEIDLVMTDYSMPDMDGIALTSQIRQLTQDIPIIIISGNVSMEPSEFQEQGKDAFLQKPFNLDDMAALVQKMLNEY